MNSSPHEAALTARGSSSVGPLLRDEPDRPGGERPLSEHRAELHGHHDDLGVGSQFAHAAGSPRCSTRPAFSCPGPARGADAVWTSRVTVATSSVRRPPPPPRSPSRSSRRPRRRRCVVLSKQRRGWAPPVRSSLVAIVGEIRANVQMGGHNGLEPGLLSRSAGLTGITTLIGRLHFAWGARSDDACPPRSPARIPSPDPARGRSAALDAASGRPGRDRHRPAYRPRRRAARRWGPRAARRPGDRSGSCRHSNPPTGGSQVARSVPSAARAARARAALR